MSKHEDEELEEKIQRWVKYLFPFAVLIILGIVAFIMKAIKQNNKKEDKADIIEVTTEETPLQYEESVDSAVLYLRNSEGSVTLKAQDYDAFKGCYANVNRSKVNNYGNTKIISSCVDILNDTLFYNGVYSIFGDNLQNCIFRIIPNKKDATQNKYQYFGVNFEKVDMYAGSVSCDEVCVQYKKAIHIINQRGMFYIYVELKDEEDINRLGFHDISVTGRLEEYSKETGKVNANISCYITEDGFEFFSDTPIKEIILDRDSTRADTWNSTYLSDTSSFVFKAKDFIVNGESYNTTDPSSEEE